MNNNLRFMAPFLLFLTLSVVSVLPETAQAKPAPWYLWQSRLDGKFLCLQTTPGDGWVRVGGPYGSAQCRRYISQRLIWADGLSRH